MAPRALVSRIDCLKICASPKASCRSVADFAWEVANSKAIRVTVNANLIVFRNPYRRLISAFLNKYVEHHKYLEASLQRSPKARLDTFAAFVAELDEHHFRCVDKTHFKPQISRYRWQRFDRVFNSEDLAPLRRFVNELCGTSVAMPFRVAAERPGQVRDRALELVTAATPAAASISTTPTHRAASASGGQPAPAGPDGLGAEPWHLHAEQLRPLLASGASLDYARFFNPDLLERTRRIYRADLAFLAAAQRRGVIDRATHASLTSL